jgi:hypothetical protein
LAAGKGYADVKSVGSRPKIERLEDGRGPYKSPDVRELCRLYGVSAHETNELAELAERTKQERVWDDYTDLLPGTFGTYVDLESAANRISTWQPDAVPGLLQIPDYARAVFRAVRPRVREDDIERLVAVRVARQQAVFKGTSNARIQAILNEAVLARQVGGSEVAAVQLERLRELAGTRRVDVRVLTFAAGAHAGMVGAFTLMEFADPEEPKVAYVESPAGARLIDRPTHFANMREAFDSLAQQSIPLKEYPA